MGGLDAFIGMADIFEHPQLIESAFVNYLLNLDPPPWLPTLTSGGGDAAFQRIFPGENNLAKDGQNIVAYVDGDMGSEDPPCSGNRWCDVIVRLKTPATVSTGDEADALAEHQAMATALQKTLLVANLADLLTAAIDNFTCFGITDRQPFRAQDDSGWVSGWKIRLYSCPSAFPN